MDESQDSVMGKRRDSVNGSKMGGASGVDTMCGRDFPAPLIVPSL